MKKIKLSKLPPYTLTYDSDKGMVEPAEVVNDRNLFCGFVDLKEIKTADLERVAWKDSFDGYVKERNYNG